MNVNLSKAPTTRFAKQDWQNGQTYRLGLNLINRHGTDKLLEAYNLDITGDLPYWVGTAAIHAGDANWDGTTN